MRILLLSDVHDCHIDWYGVPTADRLAKLTADVRCEHEKEPFTAIFLLGDYALDFWGFAPYGCYLRNGVSHTAHFVQTCLRDFPAPVHLLAGNHDQYGEGKFRKITGCARQSTVVYGDTVFLLLDTFAGGLDPDFHHDGIYTGADTAYIRCALAQYPDKQFFLLAHDFNLHEEGPAFLELLCTEERLLCLFAGHAHRSDVSDFAGKYLCRTGNYSYSAEADPDASMWGYRELRITDTAITTAYLTPESVYVHGGTERHHQPTVQDSLTLPRFS